MAETVARQEAMRRGWKGVRVHECRFRDGLWRVYISRAPRKMVECDAVVSVAPDGTVVGFFINEE